MTIHTIGDSHCKAGFRNVVSHHLGPLLCYSFGKDPLNRCPIEKFGIKEGDVIIFCLGEIDCRCHIHKHISDQLSMQKIIDDIVEEYFKGIKLCVSKLHKRVTVSVFNVVPTVHKKEALENLSFPFLGTDEERRSYVLYFNEKLKEFCKEYNYIFFDIFDAISKDGFFLKSMKDETVHVKDTTMIQNFIDTYLIQ